VNRLEQELKTALQQVEPPEGFADRVLARAAAAERPKASGAGWGWWQGLVHPRGLRWGLTGALCAMIAGGGAVYKYEQDRRAAGEAAKEQLMLALRVTASKLQLAESKVREINSQN
jgi:hypothetical protein